jgi:glutaredoxin-related protein
MYKTPNWNSLKLSEKIRIYGQNLNSDYAKYVDKLLVKEHILTNHSDIVKVANIRKTLENFSDITTDDIKPPCLIKTAHASGCNVLIENESDLNLSSIIEQLKHFNRKYHEIKPNVLKNEKQYLTLEPKFFIEECVNDKYFGNNCQCITYMFHCFHGTPRLIRVSDKYNHQYNTYDTAWNPLLPQEIPTLQKPTNLPQMLHISKTLSSEFDYVRIDLYLDVDDNIYFSEYTFTPNGGHAFLPPDLDYKFGSYWT